MGVELPAMKRSFQATCHGTIYRNKSYKCCNKALKRMCFVGCRAWHLAVIHADLTQYVHASSSQREVIWALGKSRNKRHSSSWKIRMDSRSDH